MNIYFDTEFTGLHKNTTLISIGMISEDNRTFYAELTDFDYSQVDEWIANNVLSNLIIDGVNDISISPDHMMVKGNKEYVKHQLLNWFMQFETIQFVSDVITYDFALLIDIFGTAFDLLKKVSPCCIDINQMIASYYNIDCKTAFDKSREDIVECNDLDTDQKHNSLYDAKIIKKIYDKITA